MQESNEKYYEYKLSMRNTFGLLEIINNRVAVELEVT